MTLRIGIAGWRLRREQAARFGAGASHLARYATGFNAVEINSSFYRPHRAATYARWASVTPDGFAFSVKMPRQITHERRLIDCADALEKFFGECRAVEHKLGCVLMQLPPSLHFDRANAEGFLGTVRALYEGPAALEPRHESWFGKDAERLLSALSVARVAADPVPASVNDRAASKPAGHNGLRYWRLHGSPRIYYSEYDGDFLRPLAADLIREASRKDVWCIFDNTALGYATVNALDLRAILKTIR